MESVNNKLIPGIYKKDENFNNIDTNDLDIDHVMVEKMNIANTIAELDDFSVFLSFKLQNYIHSTGCPIGNNIKSTNIFDFNILLLQKYEN